MSALGFAAVTVTPALSAVAGFALGRWSTRRARCEIGRALATAQEAAQHDPLTGLVNRAGLLAELGRRSAGREPFAVLLLDLDGFKAVNDRYGHAAGDAVLVAVAERLAALVGRAGVAARLGGDEFVLVATSPTTVVARLLGYDVVRAVAHPIEVDSRRVEVRASVGVVQALPGDDVSAVLHSADVAMFRAKTGQGQAGVAEYDPVLGVADMVEARPAVRVRELTWVGRDLAVTR